MKKIFKFEENPQFGSSSLQLQWNTYQTMLDILGELKKLNSKDVATKPVVINKPIVNTLTPKKPAPKKPAPRRKPAKKKV